MESLSNMMNVPPNYQPLHLVSKSSFNVFAKYQADLESLSSSITVKDREQFTSNVYLEGRAYSILSRRGLFFYLMEENEVSLRRLLKLYRSLKWDSKGSSISPPLRISAWLRYQREKLESRAISLSLSERITLPSLQFNEVLAMMVEALRRKSKRSRTTNWSRAHKQAPASMSPRLTSSSLDSAKRELAFQSMQSLPFLEFLNCKKLFSSSSHFFRRWDLTMYPLFSLIMKKSASTRNRRLSNLE